MFGSVSKIKLRGGVVGKVCTVLVVVAVAMAAIAWAARLVWVSVLALVLIFILCFPLLWRLIRFAEKNPQAALFEGAEFLAHEQMQLGMKATPILPSTSPPLPPPGAPPLAIEDVNRAQTPDATTRDNPQLDG